MSVSILTKKWQTTIPKDIRKLLGLKEADKILYYVEGEKVIIKPLKGNILDVRGSVVSKEKPLDFARQREKTKKKISRKIIEESK